MMRSAFLAATLVLAALAPSTVMALEFSKPALWKQAEANDVRILVSGGIIARQLQFNLVGGAMFDGVPRELYPSFEKMVVDGALSALGHRGFSVSGQHGGMGKMAFAGRRDTDAVITVWTDANLAYVNGTFVIVKPTASLVAREPLSEERLGDIVLPIASGLEGRSFDTRNAALFALGHEIIVSIYDTVTVERMAEFEKDIRQLKDLALRNGGPP